MKERTPACMNHLEIDASGYQSAGFSCWLPKDHSGAHQGGDVAIEYRSVDDGNRQETRQATVTITWTWDEWEALR